jgi:hypothetical protein
MKLSKEKLYDIKPNHNFFVFLGSLENRDFYLTFDLKYITVVYSNLNDNFNSFNINASGLSQWHAFILAQKEAQRRLPALLLLK